MMRTVTPEFSHIYSCSHEARANQYQDKTRGSEKEEDLLQKISEKQDEINNTQPGNISKIIAK